MRCTSPTACAVVVNAHLGSNMQRVLSDWEA
jgi:hypothetical protein